MSAVELREWAAFYSIDPWGEQRADLRMARTVWATIQVNSKAAIDPNDFRLYPDEANDLPDDIDDREKQWMLKLGRAAD